MSHLLNKKSQKKIRILFFLIVVLTISTIVYDTNKISLKKALNYFYKNQFEQTNEIITDLKVNLSLKRENTSLLNSNQSVLIQNNVSIALKLNKTISQCPLIPPNLGSRIKLNLKNYSLIEIDTLLRQNQSDLKLGGQWSPSSCIARYRVAVIVPFRDRDYNLQLFLAHMHPFLSKQQLEYGIYLVEPTGEITFNRGLLMNIGYVEALHDTDSKWDCFVFHDVDLLPEDERNIYSCPETPRHMSSAVSTLNYK